ncbi:MAG: sigma-70 family RNA polymerase sigma factor [Clostridia bacterium]|nr:sigma-70 family RNA polymerase sigma factor [Clostridia bacterium]
MDKFEELLSRELPVLERYIRYRIGSRHDAEDVLQEVCLAAFRGSASLNDQTLFKSWLLGIARHKCGDYFREKAKNMEIPIGDLNESVLTVGSRGVTTASVVRDTLDRLGDREKQILYLYYFKDLPQDQIAERLRLPLGTVKSRLHYAKRKFQEKYPYKPKAKGEKTMKEFPAIMPEYTIRKRDEAPFAVTHRELPGMFIVPAEHEACSFAMYDFPEKRISGQYDLTVTGRINIHGIEGVEIKSRYREDDVTEDSTIFAQLTETHCRYLGGETVENGCRRIVTFLDEGFDDAYGIGEDNCGFPVERKSEGIIVEKEDRLVHVSQNDVSDIVGRFAVTVMGKAYDTVRLIDIQISNGAMLCEHYLDRNGRTVLWRRFNADDWALDRFGKRWTEALPDNERLTVNGRTFVHWYDCITDRILGE